MLYVTCYLFRIVHRTILAFHSIQSIIDQRLNDNKNKSCMLCFVTVSDDDDDDNIRINHIMYLCIYSNFYYEFDESNE